MAQILSDEKIKLIYRTVVHRDGGGAAQDGNAGINEATTQVKSYFSTGTNLMYAIVGLIGAIKVYKNGTMVTMTLAKWPAVGSGVVSF